MTQLVTILSLLCLLAWPNTAGASDRYDDDPLPAGAGWLKQQPLTPLAVVSQSARCWRFRVWVARSPEQFARGLMFVRRLAPDGGMLFALTEERDISMWMRNTYISLDILFANKDGRIVTIHQHAKPHSLNQIHSGQPVGAVLELPAGTVDARGITVGDYLRHHHFGNRGCQDSLTTSKAAT